MAQTYDLRKPEISKKIKIKYEDDTLLYVKITGNSNILLQEEDSLIVERDSAMIIYLIYKIKYQTKINFNAILLLTKFKKLK